MVFEEFKMKVIERTEETADITVAPAVLWLHMERFPRGVVELTDKTRKIVRLPSRLKNGDTSDEIVVNVTIISNAVFRENTTVTDIVLPFCLERLPQHAFEGCTSLERIFIPKTVKAIPANAFEGCPSLSDIYFGGTVDEWEKFERKFFEREAEFGNENYPGRPVAKPVAERRIPCRGVENIFRATIHFLCDADSVKTELFTFRRGREGLKENVFGDPEKGGRG